MGGWEGAMVWHGRALGGLEDVRYQPGCVLAVAGDARFSTVEVC